MSFGQPFGIFFLRISLCNIFTAKILIVILSEFEIFSDRKYAEIKQPNIQNGRYILSITTEVQQQGLMKLATKCYVSQRPALQLN